MVEQRTRVTVLATPGTMAAESIDIQPVLARVAEQLRERMPSAVQVCVEIVWGTWQIQADLRALVESLLLPVLLVHESIPDEDGQICLLARNAIVDETFAHLYQTGPGEYVQIIQSIRPAHPGVEAVMPRLEALLAKQGGFVRLHPNPCTETTLLYFWPTLARSERHTRAAEPDGDGALILVVDDDVVILKLLTHILRRAGYEVLAAASGREALELISEYHSELALLVTDMMMPEISGFEVMQAFSMLRSDASVLVTSGLVTKAQIAQIRASGADAFLAKPFAIDRMLTTVQSLLGVRRAKRVLT